jgi:hypothetical protein
MNPSTKKRVISFRGSALESYGVTIYWLLLNRTLIPTKIKPGAQVNSMSLIRCLLDRNGSSEVLEPDNLENPENNLYSQHSELDPNLIQEPNNFEKNEDSTIIEVNNEMRDKIEETRIVQQVYMRDKNMDIFGKDLENDACI